MTAPLSARVNVAVSGAIPVAAKAMASRSWLGAWHRAGHKCSWRRRLIDEHPEHADVADGFVELLEINGLLSVGVYAEIVPFDQVPFFLGRSEHHYGYGLGSFVGANGPEHFHAVDFGKLQVEQHESGE